MKKWDYTSICPDRGEFFIDQIKRLGLEGWELVSVTSPTVGDDGREIHDRVAYFKRELPEPMTSEDRVCL